MQRYRTIERLSKQIAALESRANPVLTATSYKRDGRIKIRVGPRVAVSATPVKKKQVQDFPRVALRYHSL